MHACCFYIQNCLACASMGIKRKNKSIPIQLVLVALKYLPYTETHVCTHTHTQIAVHVYRSMYLFLLLDRWKFHFIQKYLNLSMIVTIMNQYTLDNGEPHPACHFRPFSPFAFVPTFCGRAIVCILVRMILICLYFVHRGICESYK